MINEFRGDYAFLSNFFKSPIAFEGETYPTVEHAFQAAKTSIAEERARIRANNNPVIAKRIGRKVTLRADWEEVKRDIMRELVRIKFQDTALKAQLLATGDSPLIEGNRWHDKYWGQCVCDKCGGVGQNELGKILMQVRQELCNNAC